MFENALAATDLNVYDGVQRDACLPATARFSRQKNAEGKYRL